MRCSSLERDESKRGGEGWRGTAGGRATALCSTRVVRARGKGRTVLDGKLRGLRERRRAALRCDCRRVEAAPTSTVAGMAGEHTVSSTVEEQERHSEA